MALSVVILLVSAYFISRGMIMLFIGQTTDSKYFGTTIIIIALAILEYLDYYLKTMR